MISAVKKVPVLRYSLIVLLIVVLFGSAFYLYLQYNKAEKIRGNFQKMISVRENSSLIDSCIIELYTADNSSRMYALTTDKRYLDQFSQRLKNIHNIILAINTNNKNIASIGDDTDLNNLVNEKTLKTGNYIKLMSLTDSLMRSAGALNKELNSAVNRNLKQPVVTRIKTQIRIDTVKSGPIVVGPKKKFFGRLFSALSAKRIKEPINQPVLVQKTTDTTITTMATTPKVAQIYNKYYSKIYEANNKLRTNEREMLGINSRLINQIIGSLKKYKVAEQQYIISSKNEINTNLSTVLYEFKKLSGIMFLLLTIVVFTILYNIWKIFRSEEEMLEYTQNTENYALAKSKFMASMSHEIRTPLNSIIGFSEQLSQSDQTAIQTEQTNAILSSSKMLLDVVNEILDFSKYETGKMTFEQEPFYPHEAIEEIVASMQVQAQKKNIVLASQLEFNKNLCFKGDDFRLKQVIMNLTGNAIKFTAKGSVTVHAFITDVADGKKAVLNIEIRDTGLGIAKEHLPHVFEEFSQVAAAQKAVNYGGTGLGLSICKKIIELQGGTIKATSKANIGSVFSFSLPMDLARPPIAPDLTIASKPNTPLSIAGKHILIAEDNKLNVLLVSTILKKWGVTFDIGYNGREALQLFEDNTYDMVLTDIEMPEMNGIQLTQLIRANGDYTKGSIPIWALTANVLKEDRDNYIAVGINGIILKPFSEKNLIDNICAALDTQNAMLR